ncbi:hypothetical protein F5B19DRAFT_452932 [Rostrohypoxylon terebratum]|nr:hypothetical protein F5B19DRAFT_452932 [Rostrohypoxylon terebratum]
MICMLCMCVFVSVCNMICRLPSFELHASGLCKFLGDLLYHIPGPPSPRRVLPCHLMQSYHSSTTYHLRRYILDIPKFISYTIDYRRTLHRIEYLHVAWIVQDRTGRSL